MTATELTTAVALAAVFCLRLMGLFMVLPVLALYAHTLPGATPLLVGLALGLYGFAQALLQVPFGHWSDRYGRKPVIAIGLGIFAAGGLVAASAEHIATIIIGRTLQGAGAVSGATLALAADLTRPEQRTKTMAIIGVSIGAAFSLAFVLGPIIDAHFGLRGVFLIGAGGGIGAMLLVLFAVPKGTTPPPAENIVARPASTDLRLLGIGVLCLHLILAASFVSIPLLLLDMQIAKSAQYTVYGPALLISLICVGPILGRSQMNHIAGLFPAAIACLVVAEFAMGLGPSTKGLFTAYLTVFFIGFNYLEALLPSLISRAAPVTRTGAALGAYSTGQFVGVFSGGVIGGLAATWWGTHGVFIVAGAVALLWLGLAWKSDSARLSASESMKS